MLNVNGVLGYFLFTYSIGGWNPKNVLDETACYCLLLSHLWLLETLWMGDVHNVFSSTALLSFHRLMLMASFMLSIHVILGLPLSQLPSFLPSIMVFSKESFLLMRKKKTQNSYLLFRVSSFPLIQWQIGSTFFLLLSSCGAFEFCFL